MDHDPGLAAQAAGREPGVNTERFEQVERLASIEGSVPNLVTPPSGCRFHPRCPHAMEICKQNPPQMKDLGDGHSVRCFLY